MGGAIPPLPQYAFMAYCLVKAEDNFELADCKYHMPTTPCWQRGYNELFLPLSVQLGNSKPKEIHTIARFLTLNNTTLIAR